MVAVAAAKYVSSSKSVLAGARPVGLPRPKRGCEFGRCAAEGQVCASDASRRVAAATFSCVSFADCDPTRTVFPIVSSPLTPQQPAKEQSMQFIQTHQPAEDTEMYLALDLDGVLHHHAGAPLVSQCKAFAGGRIGRDELISLASESALWPSILFERAEMFSRTITAAPSVKIVIASAWRYDLSVAQLQAALPAEIAARVAGALDNDREQDSDGLLQGIRGRLMERWMAQHAAPDARWIALDDNRAYWSGYLHRLVECPHAGIDAATSRRLKAAIRTGVGSPRPPMVTPARIQHSAVGQALALP